MTIKIILFWTPSNEPLDWTKIEVCQTAAETNIAISVGCVNTSRMFCDEMLKMKHTVGLIVFLDIEPIQISTRGIFLKHESKNVR